MSYVSVAPGASVAPGPSTETLGALTKSPLTASEWDKRFDTLVKLYYFLPKHLAEDVARKSLGPRPSTTPGAAGAQSPASVTRRLPGMQPPAALPGAGLPPPVLPQSPEDVVLAKAFVEKLLADANNDLKPDEVQAVLLLTKGQILALVEEKERRKSSRAPIVRAAFEHALAVVASMAAGGGADAGAPAAGGGDGGGDKKFPVVPVAIGAAALAAILLMRR